MNNEHTNHEATLSEDCLVCGTILTGISGLILRLTGLRRSNINPNVCTRCNMHITDGNITEVSILFIDMCSFTSLTHNLGPEKTHLIVQSFLETATKAIIDNDGFVDKYIGDAVMAIFNVPIKNVDHSAKAVAAVTALTQSLPELSSKHATDLDYRAGIASGAVRIGTLGSTDVKDLTALGDAVNRASRLQAQANPGELVVDPGVYKQIETTFPNIDSEAMNLKGFPSPVLGYRLTLSDNANADSREKITRGHSPKFKKILPLGSIIIALFGAPCIAGAALTPGAIALGIAAITGSSASGLVPSPFIPDQWWFRLPLIAIAVIAISINIFLILDARSKRKQLTESQSGVQLSKREKRKELFVLGASFIAFIIVVMEFASHHFVMGHQFF